MESFKASQTSLLNCLIIIFLHVFILNFVVGNSYMPMPYKSAIQSQCIILYGNIQYQETAVCHCIDIESMIYMHWLHQTVWSGEMTIIRANCLVQSIINNFMIVHTCINSTVVWLWCLYLTIIQWICVVYEQMVNDSMRHSRVDYRS